MKKFAFCVGLLLCWLRPLPAQVTVEVRLDQDQFLPNEALPAAVRITNRSGQTLHLGAEEDWLTLSFESKEGLVVRKNGEAPVAGEFALESSKTATKHMDLAPYFALSQQGRYAIVATVKIKDWDHQIVSVPKPFYIMEGSRLWEQAFGVPKLAGVSNTPPEVRKYILQQANYLKGPLRLYFRLTDDSGARTFRVFPIGQMVSFSRPDPQVDKLSNLHVLYQSGPQSYS